MQKTPFLKSYIPSNGGFSGSLVPKLPPKGFIGSLLQKLPPNIFSGSLLKKLPPNGFSGNLLEKLSPDSFSGKNSLTVPHPGTYTGTKKWKKCRCSSLVPEYGDPVRRYEIRRPSPVPE